MSGGVLNAGFGLHVCVVLVVGGVFRQPGDYSAPPFPVLRWDEMKRALSLKTTLS